MTEANIQSGFKMIQVEGVKIVCGCAKAGHPFSECHVWNGPNDVSPCTHPIRKQSLGLLAYWHKHWWMRLWMKIRHPSVGKVTTSGGSS